MTWWLFLWSRQKYSCARSMKPKHLWNKFEGVTSSYKVTMSMHEVRGRFQGTYDLLKPWWGQRSGFCVSGKVLLKVTQTPELTSDLLPIHYSLTGWRHTQSMSNTIWFSLTWCNCIFAWLTKLATGLFLTVTPVILQLGDDKLLIYLIKSESWPNTPYFLIQSHFLKLFTALWYILHNWNFINQSLLPYKFHGSGIRGILFFNFASGEVSRQIGSEY